MSAGVHTEIDMSRQPRGGVFYSKAGRPVALPASGWKLRSLEKKMAPKVTPLICPPLIPPLVSDYDVSPRIDTFKGGEALCVQVT